MEEPKELQSLHRLMQMGIYFSVGIEILLFIYAPKLAFYLPWQKYGMGVFCFKLSKILIYHQLLYSKCFTFVLIALVSGGTLSKKKKDFNAKNAVTYPLLAGFFLYLISLFSYDHVADPVLFLLNGYEILYVLCSISGTILIHVALDNTSKIISSKLGKDKWNIEGESFEQAQQIGEGEFTVNIPMLYYYKGKVRNGYIVLENLFRGTLVVGTPGSGKSFGVVMPVIRSLIEKSFTLVLYDFKFPDLAKVAYYHFILAKKKGKLEHYDFHVINLTEVEKSRRINPWRSEYIKTLADAAETAEALVEALKKGDKSGGSDAFFTQSAINFLASCIYFFSKVEGGKYSSLPHVLSFLNSGYEEIFETLFSNKELDALLSPFVSAFNSKSFNQLEGQVGTLKIFISRLATKETYWVFSGDDFSLKVSDPYNPSLLVLANDPNTQNINSACYSVVLNRVTRLINTKGNLPCGLIVDEVPTLFIHRIENLIATARSNKVAVLMGLQELPQFKQQYGKETASTITSVIGNIISGSARDKETLEWLERLFGKVKQESESLSIDRHKTSLSLSERLEPLIPAGKIATLKAGEVVGLLAADAGGTYNGKYQTSAVNCKINLDMSAIAKEENSYLTLPRYYDFGGKKEEILKANFVKINQEVKAIIERNRKPKSEESLKQKKGSMKSKS